MKKRIGKDFDAVISVQHDGEPINFSQYEVLWVSIDTAYRRTKLKPGTWTTAGGLITAHISRNLISSAGEHWFTVAYRKPDASIEDGYYDFEDNSESFQIVGKTEDEDAGDLTAKVELLAGLTGKAFKYEDFTPEQLESLKVKGDPFKYEDFTPEQLESLKVKGDPFRYEDFTPDQIAELQRPAADAITSIQEVELAVETAEGLRQLAENKRQTDTETAISNAEKATEEAIEAAENVVDGKSVELQTTATHIQWRLVGDANWINLVALSVITGLNGKEVELQTSGGYIQWRLTDGTWANLVEINSLISAKENTANKQNSLAPDGTGTKFPTVDAVNEGLAGASNLIASYTHSGNKEVHCTAVDFATGTFTAVGHGFVNNQMVAIPMNINSGGIYPFTVMPKELIAHNETYLIHLIDENSFKIKLTEAGTPLTLTQPSALDLTKWHFEVAVTKTHIVTGLNLKDCRGVINMLKGNSKYQLPTYCSPVGWEDFKWSQEIVPTSLMVLSNDWPAGHIIAQDWKYTTGAISTATRIRSNISYSNTSNAVARISSALIFIANNQTTEITSFKFHSANCLNGAEFKLYKC